MKQELLLSRRQLMGTGLSVSAGTALAASAQAETHTNQVDLWLAKQQIAELRQRYGFATDLIGTSDAANVAAGREIYRQIFTADASLGAANVPSVQGPDAWVDIVLQALEVYASTQHLIGTQQVEVRSLPDARGAGGYAVMQSYLQAWHAKANGALWLFIGTYHDEASYSPERGWQIHKMVLEQVSEDNRQLASSTENTNDD